MLMLLFGESLAAFMAFLVTMFFCFHIWLMLKAMTTIEFCEKSVKRTSYDSSAYDLGMYGNIKAVLGANPALWFIPVSPPEGNGLDFTTEETPLSISKDMEAGRNIRRQMHEDVTLNTAKKSNAVLIPGTGGTDADD